LNVAHSRLEPLAELYSTLTKVNSRQSPAPSRPDQRGDANSQARTMLTVTTIKITPTKFSPTDGESKRRKKLNFYKSKKQAPRPQKGNRLQEIFLAWIF